MALFGGAHHRVLSPLRSFALASVLVAIALHLLPEALAAAGPAVLVVFVVGVALPSALSRLVGLLGGGSAAAHGPVAGALAIAGVLLHQAGDGLALASFTGPEHAGHVHWDVVVGIAVHTVPLAAVITLASVERRGRRAAIVSGVGMALALLAGLLLGRSGGTEIGTDAAPWISAAVAGLLVHVLTHDVPSPPRTAAARSIELVAIVIGVALPIVAMLGGDPHELAEHGAEPAAHADEPSALAAIGEVALRVAPFALAALLVTVLARRGLAAWLRHGATGARALLIAPLAAACACELGPLARALAAGRARLALAVAAPELHVVTIALTIAMLGWRFALARVALGVVLAGVLARLFERAVSMRVRRAPPITLDEQVLHTTPWLVAGVVGAGLAQLAIPPDALASTGGAWLDVLVAVAVGAVAFVCAPAATPVAAVLVERGLPPAAALAALAVGNAATAWRAVRGQRDRRTRALALALIGAIAGGAAMLLTLVRWPSAAPHVAPAWSWQLVPLVGLGVLLLRAWWRYGLAAWIEPLHGGEHHHHQHASGAPCTPDCHDEPPSASIPTPLPFLVPRSTALAHLQRTPAADHDDHDGHGH